MYSTEHPPHPVPNREILQVAITLESIQEEQKDCMDNISSPYEETTLVTHVSLSANTLKDAFLHLRDKLGDLRNQRRPTVATDIIRRLNV